MDLSQTIIPKSDQLNADDLIAGPRTIKITGVDVVAGEQPVAIHYEGENGRPYKPGKSMRRVLIALWGTDGAAYTGKRITLYCDPTITFGADTTGGIRISHASDIDQPLQVAITVKRGKRKPFRVDVLPPDEADAAAQIGPQKAAEGVNALREWWATLPATVKASLKPRLDSEWKQAAVAADEAKKA